jgi:predicted HicB family RNase H-like nuclease
MEKYPVSIKWSDEDEGYIAVIPGVRGLSAFGESPQKALSELKTAAHAYLRSLKKAGKPLPVFAKAVPFSGQLRLRLPKSLHAELSQAAENEGISLNTYLITLLAREHTKRELLTGRRDAGQVPVHAERAARSS